jgi:hypothetical protein
MVFPFILSLHKKHAGIAGEGAFRGSRTMKGAERARVYRGLPSQAQEAID